MAHANYALVTALRKAAGNLRAGAFYAWGHHGACNCGQLLQTVTNFTREEILSFAHMGHGEWTEIAEEYCTISKTPLYLLMSELEKLGLTPTDIHNIEYLEDRQILNALPGGFRWLQRNKREDVIEYFETMADLLDEEIPVILPELNHFKVEEPVLV